MLASPKTQSPCPGVLASRPELAKGHAWARFIIKGSARAATALRNFPNASVGSGDLRRPGQLRSQRSCPAQATQSSRVLVIAALPRGMGCVGVPRKSLATHNRSGARRPLTPRGGGAGRREAGRAPAAAAPEQDGRHASAAAAFYGCLRFLGSSSPSRRPGPARAGD